MSLALILSLGGCATTNEQPLGLSPSGTLPPPLKSSQNQNGCAGEVNQLSYVTFGKDGSIYRVDGISGGEGAGACASIYKSTDTEVREVLGSVSVGDKVKGPCVFEKDEGNHVRIFTNGAYYNYVGDIPVAQRLAASMNSSTMQIPLCEDSPREGFTQQR